MQLVVGLANGCNVMLLCTEENQIRRLNIWFASCPLPLEVLSPLPDLLSESMESMEFAGCSVSNFFLKKKCLSNLQLGDFRH